LKARTLKFVLTPIYFLVLAEVIVRIVSSLTPIFAIETTKYAKELTVGSRISGLRYEHRANVSANIMDTEIVLDRHGHRVVERVDSDIGQIRNTVAFLGSSLTLGWGVDATKIFPALTTWNLHDSSRASGSDVYINAGVAGYSVNDSIALFQARGRPPWPQTIVLQIFPGDLVDGGMVPRSSLLSHSYFFLLVRDKLEGALATEGGSLIDYYERLLSNRSEKIARTLEAVRWLEDHCRQKDIRLVLLLLPDLFDFSDAAAGVQSRLVALFDEFRPHVVDAFPELRKAFGENPAEAWVTRKDRHPNEAAHAVIADVLAKFILSRAIRPEPAGISDEELCKNYWHEHPEVAKKLAERKLDCYSRR